MKAILYTVVSIVLFTGSADSQMAKNSKFYTLDRSHSEMNFAIKWMTKGKVVGTFDNISGAFYYDPQKPRELSASLVIDIKSLNSGNVLRNGTLMRDWFDTAAHPLAYFETLPLSQQDKKGKIRGKFTLKGITKIITLDLETIDPPALDYESNPFIIISGKTTISRKEFNVVMTTSRYETSETGAVAIADSVTIDFNLYGRQLSEKNALKRLGPADSRPVAILNLTKNATSQRIGQVIDSSYADPKYKNDIAVWSLANYYLISNDLERALVFLKKSDELFPGNMNVYDSMLQYYHHTGAKEEARTIIEKMLKKNAHAPSALEYQKQLK
jgi:polyisoprenoid-binding protein YceI